MNFEIECRNDHPSSRPTDKYILGTLHYYLNGEEVDEMSFLIEACKIHHPRMTKFLAPYRAKYFKIMSESSYYECCQNFGTHTAACVRASVRERSQTWQHTCVDRRDIPCAACCEQRGETANPSVVCWNVIEGEY